MKRRTLLAVAAFFLSLFLVLSTAMASTTWQPTSGPNRGYVTALAVEPANSQRLYAGTWGGVFKSTDGGDSWTPASSGLGNNAVLALAMDPSDSRTIYAGTFSSGVFKTTDGGASWSPAFNGLAAASIKALAIDPVNRQNVYAGAANGGVFKSTDAGGSWTAASPFDVVNCLAIDPANPQTIFAGTYGSNSGVFKSTDGGSSWQAINEGLPYYNANIYALVIDPHNSQTIYAGSYRSTSGYGVFKSTDGGSSWKVASDGLPRGGTSDGYLLSQVSSLVIDPDNGQILYAATTLGVYKSTDGGSSWHSLHDAPTDEVHSLAIANSKTVYAGFQMVFKGVVRPSISGTPTGTVTAGNAYGFTPAAGDASRFSISGCPAWASFDTGTGRLTGTPGSADVGSYPGIVISASDGAETASLPPFSITVQPQPTAPGTPTSVSAVAGNGQARVSYAVSDGGSAITSVTVRSSPGDLFATGTANPIAVTGLINGVSYTFTVQATNAKGTGPVSAPSNGVTPFPPASPGQAAPSSIATYLGGGVATELSDPQRVTVDSAGNLYVVETGRHRILKVAAGTGILSTVAGDGNSGYSGDNGPATAARLNYPKGVAVDGAGNLFIADDGNSRVRKVAAATGTITTVAGTGTWGVSGDGGPATAAKLASPEGVALDGAGNLYIADSFACRIRKVSPAGVITTVAGSSSLGGYSGDNGPAASALLAGPTDVVLDGAGNLYIADRYNNRIRMVTAATGIITTVAGDGSQRYSGDVGTASVAGLYEPLGVALDGAGNLYIADSLNHRVRKVDLKTGTIMTVAGTAGWGYSGDGAAATASLSYPSGVALDGNGNLFIADSGNQRIRVILHGTLPAAHAIPGSVTDVIAVAGNARASVYFTPPAFGASSFTVTSHPGNLSASGNSSPVVVPGLANGTSYTFTVTASNPAGTGAVSAPSNSVTPSVGNIGDIVTRLPGLYYPFGVALDPSGNLYVADEGNQRILRIAAGTGTVTTVAGNGYGGFSGDGGPATGASLNNPEWVATDAAGNLYIADTANNRVRAVDIKTGIISTVAGNGSAEDSGDGGPATLAGLTNPSALAVDSAGNIYIADSGNNRVRKVAASGIITTVAGNGTPGDSGDNGAASAAQLNLPVGLALDGAGNLYIADVRNNRVRRVSLTTGVITAFAGTGEQGSAGDNGAAIAATLSFPAGLALDGAGNLYIAEYYGNRIRKVAAGTGIIVTVAGSGAEGFSGDNGRATDASLYNPGGIAVDGAGNIFIADTGNNAIRLVLQSSSGLLPAGAPTDVAAVGGNHEATVSFIGSGFRNSGLAGISFTVISSPGNLTATGPASPITVTGLTNGTPYTFTVIANDAAGTSAPSLPSNSVTPTGGLYPLTVLFAGAGGGAVNGAVSCTTGAGCTPVPFAQDTQLTLLASPDSYSLFAGWSGDCTVSGSSCTVTMDGAKTVTASFSAQPPLRIVGGSAYSLLSAAFSAAANNAVIQARALLFDAGNLILNRPVSVFFKGGYDAGFNAQSGEAVLKGRLEIRNGTLRVDGLTLR